MSNRCGREFKSWYCLARRSTTRRKRERIIFSSAGRGRDADVYIHRLTPNFDGPLSSTNQPDPWDSPHTHTLSRKTPHPHPDFDRCLALTLDQSLTESRPAFRARRGYSAAQQAAIKTKPTAKPGRRRASPRFDTYSLVIPASCPDTVRSQTGMTSPLRPHARRRPLQQRNGR